MNLDPYTRSLRSAVSRSTAITTHNTNPLPEPIDELFIGTGGDVTVRLADDKSDLVLKNLTSGSALSLRITHVRTSGTTATNLVGFFYK